MHTVITRTVITLCILLLHVLLLHYVNCYYTYSVKQEIKVVFLVVKKSDREGPHVVFDKGCQSKQ